MMDMITTMELSTEDPETGKNKEFDVNMETYFSYTNQQVIKYYNASIGYFIK